MRGHAYAQITGANEHIFFSRAFAPFRARFAKFRARFAPPLLDKKFHFGTLQAIFFTGDALGRSNQAVVSLHQTCVRSGSIEEVLPEFLHGVHP